jgi:hypothetical protein
MRQFFRELLCFHASWAKAAWKPFFARANENYYVCKDCGHVRNFGFDHSYGILAFPNMPVNFDCSDEVWVFNKRRVT